jgi:HlyD family secretion protein
MKKKVKIIGVLGLVLIIVAYSIYSYLQPMPVEGKLIEPRDSEIYFLETGTVFNEQQQTIYPSVSGEISGIEVEEGMRVKQGDVLVIFDTTTVEQEYASQQIMLSGYEAQMANAELEIQMQMDTLRGNRKNLVGQLNSLAAEMNTEEQKALEDLLVSQSQSQYEQSLVDLEKHEKLYKEGYIAKSELDAFEKLVDGYEAAYKESQVANKSSDDYYDSMRNALYGQIDSIDQTLGRDMVTPTKHYYKSMIDSSKKNLEKIETQLEKHTIKAPFDGIISEVMIGDVNRVQGVEPLLQIIGEKDNIIEVTVNTRDVEAVNERDRVMIKHHMRSGDVEIPGVITYVSENATVERSPLGIEERKVLLKVKPEANDYLKPGFEVDIKFTLFSDTNQLVVPISAIYKVDGQDMVMVIRDDVAIEQKVTLGHELTGEQIVTEGIYEGDVVITDLDAKGLKPGKRVKKS